MQDHRSYSLPTPGDLFRVDRGSIAGDYLRSEFWFPVAAACQIAPGSARPVDLMGTKITLYRSASGKALAVGAFCPHRHTLLATGYVEGESIRCIYHGWRFDEFGHCLEQPLAHSCSIEDISIAAYPCEEYLGLVFVYLGDKRPLPPMPRFPELESRRLCFAEYVSDWPCNFFTMVEGATDWGHTVYTHRRSGLSDGLPPNFRFISTETDFGVATVNKSEQEAALTNPTQFYMPCSNLFDVPLADGGAILCMIWRVPVLNDRVRNFMMLCTDEDLSQDQMRTQLGIVQDLEPDTESLGNAILRGEFSLDHLTDRPDLIQLEDYVAQVGQLGPSVSRDCILTEADSGIVVMRELWLRELARFATGAPLKEWAHLSRWPRGVR